MRDAKKKQHRKRRQREKYSKEESSRGNPWQIRFRTIVCIRLRHAARFLSIVHRMMRFYILSLCCGFRIFAFFCPVGGRKYRSFVFVIPVRNDAQIPRFRRIERARESTAHCHPKDPRYSRFVRTRKSNSRILFLCYSNASR